MRNSRENQHKNDQDYSRDRNRQDNTYIGYSAIPGPSFDTGRYVSDQDRNFSRDAYRSENRDRTFGNTRDNNRSYGDDSYRGESGYSSHRDGISRRGGRQNYRDQDRSRGDFYEMGGYGNSQYPGGYDRSSRERSEHSNTPSGINRNRDSEYNRGRQYGAGYGQGNTDQRDYFGPSYGTVPTGGRFDNDRDFTSGGITNMGGDYDREHNLGRQYRDNYDSSGTYIGDYDNSRRNRQGSQDHNQYNSGFTFGQGSDGRPHYGNFNSGDRDDRWGNTGSAGQNWDEDRYGNRDYSQRDDRSQQYSRQDNYRNQGPNTGNAAYDRRNRLNEDYNYGRQRSNHPDEDRSFFEQAGDRLRSWFGGDEHDRNRR